jgi:hypothetical protein
MGYVTFVSEQHSWRLYGGLGAEGKLIAERHDALPLHDVCAASRPILWGCGPSSAAEKAVVVRASLTPLSSQEVPWSGGRIGAVACERSGDRAAALELPSRTDERPRLWLWASPSWTVVETRIVPDISSKLAWLEGSRIVYESVERRLVVLDHASGQAEVGPPGCCPSAAGAAHEWYAIAAGKVMRFSVERPFASAPSAIDAIDFGNVTTLRVTDDGKVFTWTEPTIGYGSRGYLQKIGERRRRFAAIDRAIGAVVGPYENSDRESSS